MKRFYYTFSIEEIYPFRGGWVEVIAEDKEKATELLETLCPYNASGERSYIEWYSEERFRKTDMNVKGNRGARCHCIIIDTRNINV